ncbi:hypothetical protein [Photorhabdus australis]|uniref:hypothetical protein n=1 Tax=Photorhabdus australis TaxID=286156 RepID=UPI000816338C
MAANSEIAPTDGNIHITGVRLDMDNDFGIIHSFAKHKTTEASVTLCIVFLIKPCGIALEWP